MLAGDRADSSRAAPAGSTRSLVTRHTLLETRGRTRPRVLLAEDNLVNQRVAVKMLEALGCAVEVVANGALALDALAVGQFDFVVMDCQMPVMDGFEAAATIRASEPADRHIPIIAMTANAMAGDRERCMAAGMDGYLSKPVRQEDLAAEVSRWLPAAPDADREAEPPRPLMAPRAPVVSAESGSTLVDREQLQVLREIAGVEADAFLAEVVAAFVSDGSAEVAAIVAAVAAANPTALMHGAHRLKGSAQNMGCRAVAETAAALESLGVRGTVDGAAPLLSRLRHEFDATAAALEIEAAAA